MRERGSALVEALIVTAIAGVVWAVVVRVLADVPAQAARWEEAAAARQRVRAIEVRVARIAAGAGPIELDVGGTRVRVPSIWPRRLGLFRAGPPGEVSSDAVTFLSRADGHRSLVLTTALAGGGASVAFMPQPGCGAAPACGVRAGDMVLAVSPGAACGLFRVEEAGERLDLAAVMQGAPAFEPGSVLLPIVVDAISFDRAEGALRRYDGYRSDNIMADGLRAVAIELFSEVFASLADGPFAGAGALAYDVDQLAVAGVRIRLTPLEARLGVAVPGASLAWRTRRWP